MLLQFTVENYLSFRDRAVLSLLADERVEHGPGQVLEGPGGRRVLRAAAVYGANGSGKSNLVKALSSMQQMILTGTRGDESLPIKPFKLAPEQRANPAHFEIELATENKRISYGFEARSTRVEAEWLYEVAPDGTELLLFEREAGEGAPRFILGDALSTEPRRRAFLEFVAEGTRPNQLLLAEALERNVIELEPVLAAIKKWTVVEPDAFYLPLFEQMEKDQEFRRLMSLVLKQAGTGVNELRVRIQSLEKHPWAHQLTLAPDMVPVVMMGERPGQVKLNSNGRPELVRVIGVHHGSDGEEVELDLEEESDGTRRLLDLVPIVSMAEQGAGTVTVIDELERSLHPLLTRMLLQLFFARAQSGAAAQLIFTTHDTNLLDHRILSRDSVWLMEKDARGGSVMYPLSELDQPQIDEVEKQGNGLEKGYLQGRFGAVPFFGSLEALGFRKEDLK